MVYFTVFKKRLTIFQASGMTSYHYRFFLLKAIPFSRQDAKAQSFKVFLCARGGLAREQKK